MTSGNDFAPILGFSDDDLTLNREGKLSERQILARKRIARSSIMILIWIVGFAFVLSGIFIFMFNTPVVPGEQQTSILNNPGSVIAALFCLLSGVVLATALRSAFFPNKPTLDCQTGAIVRGNITPDKKVYEVEINGKPFVVPQAVYNLIDPAKIYTVYSAAIAYDRFSVYGSDDNSHMAAIEEVKQTPSETKSPLEYAQEKFRLILQFTDADWEANCAGKLSPNQIAMLTKPDNTDTKVGLIMGVGGVLIPLIIVGIVAQSLLIIVLGIVLLPIVTYFIIGYTKSPPPKNLSKVLGSGTLTAEGTTKAWVTQVQHRSSRHSWTETIYHLQIGEVKFKVRENVYYAFKDGSPYRVHYVKGLQNRIVSAEQIG